jgi:hypothetical protein
LIQFKGEKRETRHYNFWKEVLEERERKRKRKRKNLP